MVPPPLPPIVETFARNTTPVAHSPRPTTLRSHDTSAGEARHRPRHHHGTTSKHLPTPDPTTTVVPDQHHRRGVEEHHQLETSVAVRRTPEPPTSSRKARSRQAQGSRPRSPMHSISQSRRRPPPCAIPRRPSGPSNTSTTTATGARVSHDCRPCRAPVAAPATHRCAPPSCDLQIRPGRR
jgi:hypothetical protein